MWNETPAGAQMITGYAALHDAFQKQLPGLRQQVDTLARRPIGG